MSFETVARVTASVLQHPDLKTALFTWHGGEPMLLPLDFYRRALAAQARLRRQDQGVGNAIQTNGTLLTDERCQFLAENRFYVGVSIDGPTALQDVQRPFVSGRGSSETVRRGLQRLADWRIEHGVLMVIDRAAIELGPRAMFDFIQTLGVKRVGFNAARPGNDPEFFDRPAGLRRRPSAHYTNARETAEFYLGLFEEYEKHKGGVRIRELEGLRQRISGEPSAMCTLAGACLGKHFLVEPNGEFAHCDLFLGDPSYTLGNVYQSTFKEMLESDTMRQLEREEARSQEGMSQCPHYRVCNGGCPHDRYIAKRYDASYSEICCGQRGLIEALTPRIRREERVEANATTA
jgi:serine-type anaerobic sulfatase-maturating enzyme